MNNEQMNNEQATESPKNSSFFITDLFREVSATVDSSYPSVCPECRLQAVMMLVELEMKSEMVNAMNHHDCDDED